MIYVYSLVIINDSLLFVLSLGFSKLFLFSLLSFIFFINLIFFILFLNLSHNLMDGLILFVPWKSLYLSHCHFTNGLLFIRVAKHFLVVLQDFVRQSLEDPGMLQSLQWSHSIYWMPYKATIQKVKELIVIAFKNILQLLCIWIPNLAS